MPPIVPSTTDNANPSIEVATIVVSSLGVSYDLEMTRFVAVTVPPEAVLSMMLRISIERFFSISLLSSIETAVTVKDAVNDSSRLADGRDVICNNPTIRSPMFKLRAVSLRIICFIVSSTLPSIWNEKTLWYNSDMGGGVLLINVVTFVINKVIWEVVNGVVVFGMVVSALTLEVVNRVVVVVLQFKLDAEPTYSECFPTAQSRHDVEALVFEYFPAIQSKQTLAVLAFENFPEIQSKQTLAEFIFENFPALQSKQTLAAFIFEYFPAKQSKQTLAEICWEYFPGTQFLHSWLEPNSLENFPGKQLIQLLAPIPRWYFPIWQLSQGRAEPWISMNLPASQVSQKGIPCHKEYFPKGHKTHV